MFELMATQHDGLLPLYARFFHGNELREAFRGPTRTDLIYLESFKLKREWRGQQLEAPTIDRIWATLGASSAIGVIAAKGAGPWAPAGAARIDLANRAYFVTFLEPRVVPELFDRARALDATPLWVS